MKKKLSVINVETQAFDNQKVTLKGADVTVKIHLHDAKEHDTYKEGDEVTLEISGGVKALSKKSAPAKKKKSVKKVTAPVVAAVTVPQP